MVLWCDPNSFTVSDLSLITNDETAALSKGPLFRGSLFALSSTAASSHTGLYRALEINKASVAEKLDFLFYSILTNLNLNSTQG
jgi:hypothetical protein